jgi:membrane-associated phospholipid phosphatase
MPRGFETPMRRWYPPQVWLLCSVALLLLVIGLRLFLGHRAFPGDAWAAQLGVAHKPWIVFAITRVYQQVGRPLVAVGEVLVISVWLWRNGGRRVTQGLLIALLASASCGVIKIVCGPTQMWLSLHHVGTNFPSGVVTFMTASVGYLGAVAWQQGRRLTAVLLLTAIAGAGPARVLGGQHLLSDVLGGYMLGSAWLIAACVYVFAPGRRLAEDPAWSVAGLEASV